MDHLTSKIGLRITKFLKHFIPLGDLDIPKDIFDQEADGKVILEFSDNTFLLLEVVAFEYGIGWDKLLFRFRENKLILLQKF